jgi:EgtB-related family protein
MRQVNTQSLTKALQVIRAHTLQAFECYLRADKLSVPLKSNLNPPVWELGHIAWFQEYWIGRNQQRLQGIGCNPTHPRKPSLLNVSDAWFDSAKVPHAKRWDAGLPPYPQCLDFAEQSLAQTLELLQNESNTSSSLYFYWLVLQHEAMHLEASAYMAQALQIPFTADWQAAPFETFPRNGPQTARVPAQTWILGSGESKPKGSDPLYCFDNELMQLANTLESFEIDLQAVTWAQYLNFVTATNHPLPPYIRKTGAAFEAQVFGHWAPLQENAPAVHISWQDAQSYCVWAKRRLPTEAEWDCAAKTLAAFEWGEVWEWTQDTFGPYQGFEVHPYAEYSAPWFGTHKVLRGAARLTHPVLRDVNYRNFFTPERKDIYSGLRTCAL